MALRSTVGRKDQARPTCAPTRLMITRHNLIDADTVMRGTVIQFITIDEIQMSINMFPM